MIFRSTITHFLTISNHFIPLDHKNILKYRFRYLCITQYGSDRKWWTDQVSKTPKQSVNELIVLSFFRFCHFLKLILVTRFSIIKICYTLSLIESSSFIVSLVIMTGQWPENLSLEVVTSSQQFRNRLNLHQNDLK